jgi:hypothetical protein
MHPLLISLLFTVVGIIAYIVHQKSRHEEVENINIAKTAVFSFGLSVASIYTYMYLSDASDGGIDGGSVVSSGSGIEQDIMVGNPNF